MPSHPTLTSLLLSAAGLLTLASPLIGNDVSPIKARDEFQPTAATFTCLYMTNEPNWGGEGLNLCEVGGTCGSKLPDGLTANVSSAGPEAGVTCLLFSEQNCTGDRSAPLVNPGYGDLKAIKFDKKAQSWKCWKWCGWMGDLSSSSASSAATASSSASLEASIVGARSPRLVSITTTIDLSAQTATTAPGLPSVSISSSSTAESSSAASSSSSQAAVFETSMTTIVVTHTYADGSITVVSSPLAIPVPIATGPDSAGGAVSMTTTIGQTLRGPAPFASTTTSSGVRITTTLSDAESSSVAAGVSIMTTFGVASPVPTQTSEGVTMAVPTVSPSTSAPSPATSSSEAAVEA